MSPMAESKLNRMERSIVAAEDSAEDARWLQAEEVVRRLGAGEKQADIASSWINLRVGKSYPQAHVSRVKRVWAAHGSENPRPAWATALAGLEATSRSERAPAQAHGHDDPSEDQHDSEARAEVERLRQELGWSRADVLKFGRPLFGRYASNLSEDEAHQLATAMRAGGAA